jgi:hypothetical protein
VLNTNFNSFPCSGARPCTGGTRNCGPMIPIFLGMVDIYKNFLKSNLHAVTVEKVPLNQHFTEFWTDGSMGCTRNYEPI